MSWKLETSYFETCSCNVVCPCTASLALGATLDRCRLTGIFHPAGSELTVAHATRSKIDAFGIQYQGNAAFSTSHFSWAA